MLKRLYASAAIALALLANAPAEAQIVGSYPYTLTNGTTADANQVMANFNYVTGQVNLNALPLSGGTLTGPLNGTSFSFSAGGSVTGTLTAGAFSGPLTGNVTGNVSGNAGTVTNGIYTTNIGSYAPSLTGAGASGTWGISISGNAATATNGITTGNIGSYAPSLTGGGASGTWSINVTGNAGTATTATTVSNGAITPAKLSTGGPSWDTSSNLTVPGSAYIGAASSIEIGSSASASDLWFDFSGSSRINYNRTNGKWTIYTNGVAVFSIDTSGNVIAKGTVTQNGTP